MQFDLELIKVGKTYDTGVPAVIDFNLGVEKGEFIAFLGPSGCGKTTTLRMIAGFESITTGDILIKGRKVNELSPQQRPTSMIFQNYALFSHMTVRRNVRYGLEVKQLSRREQDAKVDHMLSILGLEDIAEARVDRLSGGQRQRIALARSLVVEPDILLLDEPLGALDANLRKVVQNELKLLQKNLGITFVFVTHAQSEALSLSDRIVVMSQGRIEQISPPHELYTRPRTPFVAQFIGRNTIIDGTVTANAGAEAVLDTPLGRLTGTRNGDLVPGTAAKIIVPAEAIDIAAAGQGVNSIAARLLRADLVGHIKHLSMQLPDGRAVTLEAHAEKYPSDLLAAGRELNLTWAPAQATVIPATVIPA
jgi:putative spermidine/putrescine transport system ATP-binding protein/spermidine/putrescine transport system ATP-binding protein